MGAKPVALALQQGVPADAQRLIWEEFFASRGRGIDWATHLPWASEGGVLCASATVDTIVVAALLIRPIPGTTTAMIGYVCVDPAFRGHGLSGRLIDLACESLRPLDLGHLLLWTGKPAVYARVGFTVASSERRMTIRPPIAGGVAPVTLLAWPERNDVGGGDTVAGLPPFATAAWQATTPGIRILMADTPMGATLLDHSGSPDAVLRVMAALRPGDWSVTLEEEHPLRTHAMTTGLCYDDAPGPLTMYRALGTTSTAPAYVPPAFRI